MFAQLANAAQNLWLTALWLAWAGMLFGGFIFGSSGERRMPLWTRLLSSGMLVLAGWSWYLFTLETLVSAFSLLIAIGMTLGLIGDVFMARPSVPGGIAAFGLGHVLYIAALLHFGDQSGLNAAGPRLGAWLVWLLVGALGWYIAVYRGGRAARSALHYAALPYALLLASTAGFATGLALQTPFFVPLAVGAALFLLSDLILAGQLFSGLKFPLIGDVVWLTYGPAQMLIVFSVSSALLVQRSS